MIEVHTDSVTDYATGTVNTVRLTQLVCDRCGFAFPRPELIKSGGLDLCKDCIDKEVDE